MSDTSAPSAGNKTSRPRSNLSPTPNPLRRTIAQGKMPALLELHLTEADDLGYQMLRRRYLSDAAALPQLTLLGQYMRQLDPSAADLASEEGELARKLQVYADLINSGKVDLVALDDGARGRPSLDNAIAAELLSGLGVDPARLLVNIVARNRFPDQIRRRIKHFADLGIRNALLVTGDLPIAPATPARFPMDSIGMCQLARDMLIAGELPEDFLVAAAGHPNADADPDGLRTLHKVLAGAKIIITQAVFSFEPFEHWMNALQRIGVLDMAHVLAEVIPIASSRQLNILSEIPGMRVPQELIEAFTETEQRIAASAESEQHSADWIKHQKRREGVRLTRGLIHRMRSVAGVSGFYLGCVKSFDAHLELLKETPLLPGGGRSLHKVTKLSGPERQQTLAQLPMIESWLSRTIKTAHARRHGLLSKTRRWLASSAAVGGTLKALEWPKVPLFGCRQCDRCDLSPDAFVCPRGCAKQMSHGSCGAPREVDGRVLCEDTSRECTWATIRDRRAQYGVSVADQLAIRPPPSPGFFRDDTFSAFLPVLSGSHPPPDWGLMLRAPWVRFVRLFMRDYKLDSKGSPLELATLVASKRVQILEMLAAKPDMDREELLIKTLALVGTPAAHHLIEARIAQMGLPAEGCLADLSIRETFLLAEAVPIARKRAATSAPQAASASVGRSEQLLAVIREGKALRRALRRELANRLIQHSASLGVRVTFADALLDTRNVEDFLQALTILKDDLQLAAGRLRLVPGALSIHFDRIQYKHHFRLPVALRRFFDSAGNALPRTQIVVDIRQFQSADRFRANVRAALEQLVDQDQSDDACLALEDFAGLSQSVSWSINSVFWNRLRDFEQATGVNYDDSIGGSTDHNLAYVRSTARAHFDRIQDHKLSGQRLYVVEIGVAATHRARAFLDELKRISELTHTRHYEQTTYVLADRSLDILERSAVELREEHPNVEAVRIDAANPLAALEPFKGKVMHVHLCNVYDNLPTNKVARIDGELYHIEGRAFLSRKTLASLSEKHGLSEGDHRELVEHLETWSGSAERGVSETLDWVQKRLTSSGKPALAYVGWWMELFAQLRTEHRYVKLPDDAPLKLGNTPGLEISIERLQKHLEGNRDIQIHLNEQALAGFVQLLDVLHPRGVLEVVDLFVQRIEEYEQRFKGPAKYDGSTVNWLNGPLFREIAQRVGFNVRFNSFKPFDPKSVSVIMLASRITDATD